MRRMWTRALIVGGLGLIAGGAVGCAEERPPINKVQANALAKSFFVGEKLQDPTDDPEFYAQGTVIDVGYGAAQDGLFTSTYAQPVSRIKWTIQENLLIGRLTYERINNSDGKGVGRTSNDGVVVVAYPITSHFDIKRDYNPTTGEESNVIVENASDRPWNEREYMRVDWSRNLNVDSYDFDTLSMIGVYGGVSYESLAYYVNDPTDDNAPHFDAETGYFDVTNKAFATPGLVDLSHLGWGIDTFPACFLPADFAGGTAPAGSCNPVELTIRQSFKRVVDNDYEPVEMDGVRFQAFGAFTADRMGFSRNYGMTDADWHRMMARYNIWEKSHYYADQALSYRSPLDRDDDDPAIPDEPRIQVAVGDAVSCYTPETTPYGADPHRDSDGDGTEDECQVVSETLGVNGSRCDTFSQKCTLPFQKRVEKPVVWYYTSGSDQEFFDGTQWATQDWDIAMRGAVQSAKYAECMRGKDTSECSSKYPMYFGQMDENEDATNLATEVDDCRNGLAYAERGGDEARCTGLADELGEKRGYSAGVIAIAKMPEMVVLCHSPVQANDPAACAPDDRRLPSDMTAAQCDAAHKARNDANETISTKARETLAKCDSALSVRRGDMRYNQVNNIPEPQTPSPWGIMVDSDDPLTGEKIAASINVWTYANHLWSQGVVDQLRYINGELKTADITNGAYIHNWAQAYDASQRNGALSTMSSTEIDSRLASFAGVSLEQFREVRSKPQDAQVAAKLKELRAAVGNIKAQAGQVTTSAPVYAARRKLAQNTAFEAELVRSPEMQQFAGAGTSKAMLAPEAIIDAASPLRRSNPSVERNFRQAKENALAQRGACIMQEAPAPFSMVGLAGLLEAKFGAFNPTESVTVQQKRAEKMRSFLAQRAQYAVIVHEMGHSIGLRHNFVSSYDAWGFRPQYWQLRTKNGAVATACTEVTADGEGCVGPRYFDPVTKDESDNLIWMWMHSSTMDYAGEGTQDMLGLGAYDFAAARFFYGDVVSVHADASYNFDQGRGKGMLGITDNFGGILGMTYTGANGADIHYSQLQQNYDLIKDCKTVNPDDFKPANWNEARDGEWEPTLDGLIVKVDGQYSRCKTQSVDYEQYNTLRPATDGESRFYRGGPAIDKKGRTRVPYGFATDSWADVGNLSVYRHDNGADPYELFNFFVSQQELNHIFDNFRRGRNGFSVRSAANRILGRYNEKMRDGAKGLGLMANYFREGLINEGNGYDLMMLSVNYPENLLASGLAFDHFARQLARPEPGPHGYSTVDSERILRSTTDWMGVYKPGPMTKITIPNGPSGYWDQGGDNIGLGGKPLENALADDQGEYDRDYTMNAGSYYDKLYTSMLLTESVDNFISSSRTDFLDARYRAVSMADLFPDGYRRWLANNLTGDDFIKGPRIAAFANGNPVTDAEGYPAQAIGWTSWWGQNGPETCFPANGTTICGAYGIDNTPFNNPDLPSNVVPLDPQIGWEQQKFLIAWTLMYLPENAKQSWLNQMYIYELGKDADPGFQNRIEFHDPSGRVYVARTSGRETLFGKSVQRGVGARVLEWANTLLQAAYVTTSVDHDGDGVTDWYEPVLTNNMPTVIGCTAGDPTCTCESSPRCTVFQNYTEVPAFMRQAMSAYGLESPSQKGVY